MTIHANSHLLANLLITDSILRRVSHLVALQRTWSSSGCPVLSIARVDLDGHLLMDLASTAPDLVRQMWLSLHELLPTQTLFRYTGSPLCLNEATSLNSTVSLHRATLAASFRRFQLPEEADGNH